MQYMPKWPMLSIKEKLNCYMLKPTVPHCQSWISCFVFWINYLAICLQPTVPTYQTDHEMSTTQLSPQRKLSLGKILVFSTYRIKVSCLRTKRSFRTKWYYMYFHNEPHQLYWFWLRFSEQIISNLCRSMYMVLRVYETIPPFHNWKRMLDNHKNTLPDESLNCSLIQYLADPDIGQRKFKRCAI